MRTASTPCLHQGRSSTRVRLSAQIKPAISYSNWRTLEVVTVCFKHPLAASLHNTHTYDDSTAISVLTINKRLCLVPPAVVYDNQTLHSLARDSDNLNRSKTGASTSVLLCFYVLKTNVIPGHSLAAHCSGFLGRPYRMTCFTQKPQLVDTTSMELWKTSNSSLIGVVGWHQILQ